MGRRFTGWPEEAFEVLLRLDGDPSPAVRERHRKDRERLVRQPMVALMQDIADADPALDDFSVWGYGKMVRWWQRQGAMVRIAPHVELGVRFDLDGLWVQGVWWYAPPAMLARYRAAVADDTTGDELARIVGFLAGKGFEITGDRLKRPLRGHPPDHPRADLLRHRSLGAAQALDGEEWLHTSEAVDRVLATFAELRPLLAWFAEHVATDQAAGEEVVTARE